MELMKAMCFVILMSLARYAVSRMFVPKRRYGAHSRVLFHLMGRELLPHLVEALSGSSSSNGSAATSSGVPFKIRTTCDVLNIRAGAGTGFKVKGQIKETEANKNVYTIVEVSNGWGKLKSKAGWVSLAYTKKSIERLV